MDSLDHMLTDPLELGPCGDGHGARIMEDCLLGDTRVSLPEDLLEDVSYVITIFSSLSFPTALCSNPFRATFCFIFSTAARMISGFFCGESI